MIELRPFGNPSWVRHIRHLSDDLWSSVSVALGVSSLRAHVWDALFFEGDLLGKASLGGSLINEKGAAEEWGDD